MIVHLSSRPEELRNSSCSQPVSDSLCRVTQAPSLAMAKKTDAATRPLGHSGPRLTKLRHRNSFCYRLGLSASFGFTSPYLSDLAFENRHCMKLGTPSPPPVPQQRHLSTCVCYQPFLSLKPYRRPYRAPDFVCSLFHLTQSHPFFPRQIHSPEVHRRSRQLIRHHLPTYPHHSDTPPASSKQGRGHQVGSDILSVPRFALHLAPWYSSTSHTHNTSRRNYRKPR